MDYQGNSRKSKDEALADKIPAKQLEKVVTSEVVQKPKSLGSKFKTVFLGGDLKEATRYVIAEVLFPALRNTIVEIMNKGTERIVYGESSRRMRAPVNRPYIQYNNPMANRYPPDPRDRAYLPDQPRRSRIGSRDLENIIVGTRSDAENVVERLIDIVDQYQVASVGDLYALLGLNSSHVDEKYGWTLLNNVQVRQVREGYLIDLPLPEEI
jgi:hypothetical protein